MYLRKQPQVFSVNSDSVSAKRMKTLLPFKGLESNENPLMTTEGSCADMLNMVVDDSAFLTLRPRLIDDPVYKEAFTEASGEAFSALGTIIGSYKLKDIYLFLFAKTGNPNLMLFVENGTVVWLPTGADSRQGDVSSFSDFIIFPEKDYFRFIKKSNGKHYVFAKFSGTWDFRYATEYIPTYKLGLQDISSLESTPVYEDLNILSNSYKLSFSYGNQSTLDLEYLAKTATSVSKSGYTSKFTTLSDRTIIEYTSEGFTYFYPADYASVLALGSGSVYTFNFYYYSLETKVESILFTIKVYGSTGSYSDGISKANLALLYTGTNVWDGNRRLVPAFVYDSGTSCFVKAGGYYDGTDRFVYVYKYNIGTKAFSTTTLVKTSLIIGIVDDNTVYYGKGFVGFSTFSPGVCLVIYDILSSAVYTILGKVRDDGRTALCTRNSLSEVQRPICNVFYANSAIYVVTSQTLDFYAKQVLVVSTDNYLNKATAYPTATQTTCLYYNLGSAIDLDNVINLTETAAFSISLNPASQWYTPHISGTQGLLYPSILNATYPVLLRIPFNALTACDTVSIAPVFSAHPEFSAYKAMITSWGIPMVVGTKNTSPVDIALIKIDMDGTKTRGGLQYSYFLTGISSTSFKEMYPNAEAFTVQHLSGSISVIGVTEGEIEFTYSLTNNATNPLVIDSETLAKYNEYKSAHLFSGEAKGTALMSLSRLYYNDNYAFFTEPDNYDYIPSIHCHKTAQPIRFASSYLQTIGVIYERNNIEYVSFTDNPFASTEPLAFVAHPSVLLFESVEQRAIDYLKNGHLVTFSGLTVYLNSGGLYGLNFDPDTPQDSERKASLMSAVINTRLLKEDLSTCILANSDPYILLMFPKVGYTAIYAMKLLSSMWFYWEIPMEVTSTVDDNAHLRLIGSRGYTMFDANPVVIEHPEGLDLVQGNIERYLDFDEKHIKWFWKSQPLTLGSITARKQIMETYFTFVNPNASIDIDFDSYEVIQNTVAVQRFGLRYYTFKEIITEAPMVEYDGQVNIINNIRRRTYLNRFKFCQLLCYNIEDENSPTDKVRLADIEIIYKYLTGGK